MIRARGLCKQYGRLRAVDGIDFEVREGECFGFLGPNGAGKSTTMRMLYCATPVDGGELEILGKDVTDTRQWHALKERIGVVPQEDNLDQDLTLRENLEIFSRFYGLRGKERKARVDELLHFVELEEKAHVPILALSGGMKRRALIARGLVGDPEILILDEPTTGLDPQARQNLWERLFSLKQRGRTLLLSTHYMEEAEKLCDRLVIMDKGKIVAEGSPRDLIRDCVPRQVVELFLDRGEDFSVEGMACRPERVQRTSDRVLCYTDRGEELMSELLARYPEHRAALRPSDLEDVFLEITGRQLED